MRKDKKITKCDHEFSKELQNKLLFRLSNKLLRAGDLNEVLNRAAEETIDLMKAYTVSIALYDKERKKLVIEVIKRSNGKNYPLLTKEFDLGKGIAGTAAFEKRVVCEYDIKKSSLFIGKRRSINPASAIIAVPMIFRGKLVGVLNVSIGPGRKFSNLDKEFLTILSIIIASSIENSRLLSETKKKNVLLNSVLEDIQNGVAVTDQEFKILLWNRYIENFTGISQQKAFGQNLFELFESIGIQDLKMKCSISKANQTESFERLIDNIPGENIWLNLNISYLKDEVGNINNIILVARDITAEKALMQTKDDLITTATHELRTPLTAVKGYLSMIRDDGMKDMNKKEIKYLDRAYTATERLVSLVEDLLDALKIDENKINLDINDFDLGKVILESIANLNSKAEAKKIQIRYKYKPLFAHGDPVKTKHVIENLLDNAIKYTKNNGFITLSAKEQFHDLMISIKDNGVGIPQKYHDTIFDRFSRINNVLSVKAGGTGLGLYIAKNLIEKQMGKIWVESEPKKGTTFNFTLPASNLFTKKLNN